MFLPEDWNSNRNVASLPYDQNLLESSISLLRQEAPLIRSELDYLDMTNTFYDQHWQRSEESEERFEEIWNQVHYIYRADLSEETMIKLLRTRSGIMTISSYFRTHWDEILSLDKQLKDAISTEQKYFIQRQMRMYLINVPIIRSVVFNQRSGYEDLIEYTIVEANYDQQLGLLLDNSF